MPIYRIGVFSDIHGDVEALKLTVARLREVHHVDEIACLGDLVDSGDFPEETISFVRDSSILCVRGNHDRWALKSQKSESEDKIITQLSYEAFGFLNGLPTRIDKVYEGVRVAFRHAGPRSDMDGFYPRYMKAKVAGQWLTQCEADVMLVGHTHTPFAFQAESPTGLICNPGTLLSRVLTRHEGTFRGTYGILELPTKRFSVFDGRTGSMHDLDAVNAKAK